MFNKNNVTASFNPSTIVGSKAIGYGSVDFAGVSVNYTVYPSTYGLGIGVVYPSRPRMKDGVQVKDPTTGKPVYNNEVFIKDFNIRTLADEAVLNAMSNKGVYTQATAQQVQQAGGYVAQSVTPSSANTTSFSNPNSSQTVTVQSQVTESVKEETIIKNNSVVSMDELPF